MKKFIIAICGVMLAGGAIGADRYREPITYSSTDTDSWPSWESDYNQVLGSTIYKDLEIQMLQTLPADHGTWIDEGAVVLIIARDIYEHGGNFCMTQIQAANANTRRYTWLDYYDYPTEYDCTRLCIPSFSGSECKSTSKPDCSRVSDSLNFGKYKKKTNGKDDNQITGTIKTLGFLNSQASTDTIATHKVLVVTKKMDHGVFVSPVKIIGERYQSGTGHGKYSYVKSVESNGQEILLCAEGYTANSGKTDCIEDPRCQYTYDYCDDIDPSDYSDDEKYEQVYDTEKECYKFECNTDNGYAKDSDGNCKKCETTRNRGIKDGVCVTCPDDKVFNNGNCDKYKQLSKHALLDGFYNIGKCWMKSDPSEYKNCALCQSDKSYNETNKQCE